MTSALPEPPLVLIVDDNDKNLRLHRDVLRADGLRTIEAATGAEAIELATAHTPAAVRTTGAADLEQLRRVFPGY